MGCESAVHSCVGTGVYTSMCEYCVYMYALYICEQCVHAYHVHGPAYARRMFKTIQELGLRSARRGEDLHLPTPRCSLISRSFQYRAGLEWNAIPLAIRQAHPNRFNHDLCMFYMD